ncbi:hypothetical protein LEP3755_34970 [Leptolyngbya sp. NIES-3755]|nr:hypothetical protein LEP3755_34970 [Leptolyngbya sp. NIES-3755]
MNNSLEPHVSDAESLEGYRYLVWLESEALWKETDPQRRANLALSLAEYTATLARLEVEAAKGQTVQSDAMQNFA